MGAFFCNLSLSVVQITVLVLFLHMLGIGIMKKILGVILSVLFLTNIRGAADGPPSDLENVAIVQPGAEAASSVDARLSHLENMTAGLIEVNQSLVGRVGALEVQNTILTEQNTELHSRLEAAEVWIKSEKRRQASLAASLRGIQTGRQHQAWNGGAK